MSIISLMVGMAVGLLVAAAAVAAVAQHAGETSRLMADARVTQALRTSTELITRHLRRAGHWHQASNATANPAALRADAPGTSPPAPPNPHGLDATGPSQVQFSYSSPARDAADAETADSANDHFGLRLHEGAVELAIGSGTWQALTDPALMRVTALQVVPRVQRHDLTNFCTRPCASAADRTAGQAAVCPPYLEVTDVTVRIEAQALTVPPFRRESVGRVRLRNDRMVGQCAP